MVTEKALPRDGYALVVCPNFDALADVLSFFKTERSIDQRLLAIANDPPQKPVEIGGAMTALAAPVSTDPSHVARVLKTPPTKLKGIYGQDYARNTIVFCEEELLDRMISAQTQGAPAFDLVIHFANDRSQLAKPFRQIKQIKRQKWLIISNEIDKSYLYDFNRIIFGKKTEWGEDN